MKRFILWIVSIMIVSALLAGAFLAATPWQLVSNHAYEQVNISQSLDADISSVHKLQISAVSANIKIIPTNDTQLHAELNGTAYSLNGSQIKLVKNQDGDSLFVGVEMQNGGFPRHSDLTLTIWLPVAGLQSLNADSVSGGISLRAFSIESMTLNTVSGDIQLQHINSSQIHVQSVSGETKLDAITTQKISCDSISGDMTLELVGPSEVRCSVVSGSATIRYKSDVGALSVDSVSGDVTLITAPNANFDVHFSSVSGELKSDLPLSVASTARGDFVGTIGAGGETTRLSTISGDARIKSQ